MSVLDDPTHAPARAVGRTAASAVVERREDRLPIVYVYPHCRWDMLPPARHRFLMEAMSAHTQVIFMDAPRGSAGLLGAHRPRVERIGERVTLVHDALALRYTRVGKRLGGFAARIDGRRVHRALARAGVDEYVYWVGAPDPALLHGMRSDRDRKSVV